MSKILEIIERIIEIKAKQEFVIVAICGSADTGKSTMAGEICRQLQLQNIWSDSICIDSFMIRREERIGMGISG